MKNLNDYFDDAKEITGSDYKTAQALGVSRQYLSMCRRGETFNDDIALELAELIGINPLEIIAAVRAERTKSPEMKKRWERYATGATLAIALTVGGIFGDEPTATGYLEAVNNIHYAHFVALLFCLLKAVRPFADIGFRVGPTKPITTKGNRAWTF